MKTSAILPAAGVGLRIKSDIAKPLIIIDGEPIIIHTLKNLDSHSLIDEIVLVFNSKDISEIEGLIKRKGIKKVSCVVEGGASRKESVRNGLKHISADTDIVLIHDGVRPFISHTIVTEAIEAAAKSGAAIVGVPVKNTLKKVNLEELKIEATLNRDEIWEIQTPQAFKKDLILEAYKDDSNTDASDDSFLIERLGRRVVLVRGSYFNIKITTPEDLVLAQAISKNSK